MPMPTAVLGRTDLTVSQLGFGAAPVGFLETPSGQTAKLLHFLLDHGVDLIDTAACYAGSEALLGEAIADRREDFVLVSKCGHASGLPGEDFTPPVITASIDRSLQRLRTDHIDVMLLHSCSLDVLQKGDALAALLKAQDTGKVRHVGYSGDNEAAAWAAARPEVAVIEMSLNLCDQANLRTVLPICLQHDVGVIAKRPIANAAWKDPERQPGMYKEYASEYHRRFHRMGLSPHTLGYHGHPEIEWPEIALKFTLAHEGVTAAICGTTSVVNAEHNIEAASKNGLREEVVQRIHEAFAKAAASDPGGDWSART